MALDSLCYYLLGAPFTLVTDHVLLHWLHTTKDTNPRIMRWYLSLHPFSFHIQHQAGRVNLNADFISWDGEEQLGEDRQTPTSDHDVGGV